MENTAPVAVDTAAPAEGQVLGEEASTSFDENDPSSWFELEEGKNPDGSKKTKKISVAEARKLAQKGLGADKTFNEAKAAREEAQATKAQMAQLARLMKEDPWKVMSALGLDPDAAIKSKFQRDLEESMLDPRDRELRDIKKDYQRMKQEEEARYKQAQEERVIARAQELQTNLMNKVDEALKQTGVPNNRATVAEIGRFLQSLHGKVDRAGNPIDIFKIPVKAIVTHIHNTMKSSFQTVLSSVEDDDALLENLDPAIVKRIMNAQSKKLAASGQLQRRPVRGEQSFEEDRPVKKSQAEIEREHRERIKKLDAIWKAKNR
jgi:hypothetical protein